MELVFEADLGTALAFIDPFWSEENAQLWVNMYENAKKKG